MKDVREYYPKIESKIQVGGTLETSWKELDRDTLMLILTTVREDYVNAWNEIHGSEFMQASTGLQATVAIRKAALELLAKVPDQLFTVKPDGEGWSCHDLVNHLALDEINELPPLWQSSMAHMIKQDAIHLAQLERMIKKLGISI